MRFVLIACTAAAFARPALADPSERERAFQRCYACHSVIEGEDRLSGPNLRGVVGRRAGIVRGFPYSPAMIQAGDRGLLWTRAALDALIADSEAFLPGTTMSMPPLKDAAERARIIDYLEKKR